MANLHPNSYGILLYPGFCLLDIAGPLETLNTLARMPGHEAMTLAVICKTMQPVTLSGPSANGTGFLSKQQWLPTHTFDNAPDIDVLLVPGGWGSRPPADMTAEVEFIGRRYRGAGCKPLEYLFTVCTGAGLAAQAGVLDNHRATTNKSVWNQVVPNGPKTHWVARARWVVSGNIWTTSGVSAGMDGMLAWLAHLFGEELADEIADGNEYRREKDPANDPFCDVYGVKDVLPIDGGIVA